MAKIRIVCRFLGKVNRPAIIELDTDKPDYKDSKGDYTLTSLAPYFIDIFTLELGTEFVIDFRGRIVKEPDLDLKTLFEESNKRGAFFLYDRKDPRVSEKIKQEKPVNSITTADSGPQVSLPLVKHKVEGHDPRHNFALKPPASPFAPALSKRAITYVTCQFLDLKFQRPVLLELDTHSPEGSHTLTSLAPLLIDKFKLAPGTEFVMSYPDGLVEDPNQDLMKLFKAFKLANFLFYDRKAYLLEKNKQEKPAPSIIPKALDTGRKVSPPVIQPRIEDYDLRRNLAPEPPAYPSAPAPNNVQKQELKSAVIHLPLRMEGRSPTLLVLDKPEYKTPEGLHTLASLAPAFIQLYNLEPGTKFVLGFRTTYVYEQDEDLETFFKLANKGSAIFLYDLKNWIVPEEIKQEKLVHSIIPTASNAAPPVSSPFINQGPQVTMSFKLPSQELCRVHIQPEITTLREVQQQIAEMAGLPEHEVYFLLNNKPWGYCNKSDVEFEASLNQTFFRRVPRSGNIPDWANLATLPATPITVHRRRKWFYDNQENPVSNETKNLIPGFIRADKVEENSPLQLVCSIEKCNPFDRNSPLTKSFFKPRAMYATLSLDKGIETTLIRYSIGQKAEWTTLKVMLMNNTKFKTLIAEDRQEPRWNGLPLYRDPENKIIEQIILYTLTIDPNGKVSLAKPHYTDPALRALQRSSNYKALQQDILLSLKQEQDELAKLIPSHKVDERAVPVANSAIVPSAPAASGPQAETKNYQTFFDIFKSALEDYLPDIDELEEIAQGNAEYDFVSIRTALLALVLLFSVVRQDPSRLARPAAKGQNPAIPITGAFLHDNDPLFASLKQTSSAITYKLFAHGGLLAYFISFLNELDPRFLPSAKEDPYTVRRETLRILMEEIPGAYLYLNAAEQQTLKTELALDLILLGFPQDIDRLINPRIEDLERKLAPNPQAFASAPALGKVEKKVLVIDLDLLLTGNPLLVPPAADSDMLLISSTDYGDYIYYQGLPLGNEILAVLVKLKEQYQLIGLSVNLKERLGQLTQLKSNYKGLFPSFDILFSATDEKLTDITDERIPYPDSGITNDIFILQTNTASVRDGLLQEARRLDIPMTILRALTDTLKIPKDKITFLFDAAKTVWYSALKDKMMSRNMNSPVELIIGDGHALHNALSTLYRSPSVEAPNFITLEDHFKGRFLIPEASLITLKSYFRKGSSAKENAKKLSSNARSLSYLFNGMVEAVANNPKKTFDESSLLFQVLLLLNHEFRSWIIVLICKDYKYDMLARLDADTLERFLASPAYRLLDKSNYRDQFEATITMLSKPAPLPMKALQSIPYFVGISLTLVRDTLSQANLSQKPAPTLGKLLTWLAANMSAAFTWGIKKVQEKPSLSQEEESALGISDAIYQKLKNQGFFIHMKALDALGFFNNPNFFNVMIQSLMSNNLLPSVQSFLSVKMAHSVAKPNEEALEKMVAERLNLNPGPGLTEHNFFAKPISIPVQSSRGGATLNIKATPGVTTVEAFKREVERHFDIEAENIVLADGNRILKNSEILDYKGPDVIELFHAYDSLRNISPRWSEVDSYQARCT